LLATGRELRARHWEQQKAAGIDLLPVGDFAWYDHVLTTSLLLGNVRLVIRTATAPLISTPCSVLAVAAHRPANPRQRQK
jgi:hypothetical protein